MRRVRTKILTFRVVSRLVNAVAEQLRFLVFLEIERAAHYYNACFAEIHTVFFIDIREHNRFH